jgi:glycosyltransferase involved in cell wall biosynthesis
MKKILYVITQSEFGGAQRYIFDLAAYFKTEFRIIVAAGSPLSPCEPLGIKEYPNRELFEKLKEQGIESVYLKNLKRNINPFRDILAFFELRRLIKKEKPNIIHLNSSKAGILGSLAIPKNIRPRPKIIYTAHGWVFNEPLFWLKRKIYLLLEKFTAKFKHKIICVSSFDCQIAIDNKFPAGKLSVVHNGINPASLNFFLKEIARQKILDRINAGFRLKNSNFKIIGAISNLYPTKGLNYLIEAARLLRDKNPELKIIFVVIGEGQERSSLKDLIKKYNLENIFFLAGRISRAFQYIPGFDIFAMPSVKEGLPYALLEAMAGGAPIIASKVGGIPETIVHNKTGLIVKPKDSQELAEKILYLLNNDEEAKKMGEQAQKKVKQKFPLDKMVKKTKEIYSE